MWRRCVFSRTPTNPKVSFKAKEEKMSYSLKQYLIDNKKEGIISLIKNKKDADKISYSSGKKIEMRCNCCGYEWEQSPNKLTRIRPKNYNYKKHLSEETFCVRCSGEKVSEFYNLATERQDIKENWDFERNTQKISELSPNTHTIVYLTCKTCGYIETKGINPHSTKRWSCPRCNSLLMKYPDIAKEYDNRRNEKSADEIAGASSEMVWWRCPFGHSYQAKVSNRTINHRGCPDCNRQKTTSFPEQVLVYYFQQMEINVLNNTKINKSGDSIDIILPDRKIAIEYNSRYYHSMRDEKSKAIHISEFYKVFILCEGDISKKYDDIKDNPLINIIKVPVFSYSDKIIKEYENIINHLIKTIYPNQKMIPSINIERDHINILSQYMKNSVEGSLEEKYPKIAITWDMKANRNLRPSMFKPTSVMKFYWRCEDCNRLYYTSITNRIKKKGNGCENCRDNKGRYLTDACPEIALYWDYSLNDVKLETVRVYSGKKRIFRLKDERICAVRIDLLYKYIVEKEGKDLDSFFIRMIEK